MMQVHCRRFVRGDDLKNLLEKLVVEENIKAGFVLSCVGSVSTATLRFATQANGDHQIETIKQNMEITSLVGTLSHDGCHLHISLSDERGNMIGGHLLAGTLVQTTAEIIVGSLLDVEFGRLFDSNTGFKELLVKDKGKNL